ncbi:MAG: PDZ domain-containing protein, partial [Caldilineaceae bacterium]|nr:PDZ domain-containing protein [Caldilineaceae bacterium]
QADFAGETGGSGFAFDSIDGRFQIYKVRPNTPAERAGLHVGDVLLAVDGTRITELTSGEEVALLLRGPIDQTVDITVRRANSELTLTVPRAAREQITARMLDSQVGYLKLPAFTAGVAADVRTALDELATQGMKSLVWDLRGNPGGSVRDAEAILNLFIDEGALFTVEMKQGEAETFVAQGSARWANLPMTVLIDGDSWSAAEISTAA